MTGETQALLSLILPPDGAAASPSTDSLYSALDSLHATIGTVTARLNAIEAARRAADAKEEDPSAFVFFERIKQTCAAGLRLSQEATDRLDKLTDNAWQLDKYAEAMKASVDGAPKVDGSQFITVSRAELDHLKARADAASSAPAVGQ